MPTRDPKPRVLLASASPRRRELLTEAGVAFEVVVSGIDEQPWPKELPASYALRNAAEKARWVADRAGAGDLIVIAADTIVVLEEHILEKPADAAHAADMLRRLSGRWHAVITGLCVWHREDGGFREQADAVHTRVRFKDISESDISSYVAGGEPMDKAGAYAIQGGAAAFVAETQGSYSNVVGLPMDQLKAMLARCGL